ncbi:PAS sensor-containing response regulator [Aliarcobacter faecis]|uniref:response regulator n=1 Tax=Aliarcobacter faecis TaxID=1564138 RepID=UPI00047EFB61|nr:response regulator [Aliarcobacter faecis]QKF72699.1 PAS sensor-containing response regulator [Aliarcobacter faecis]
MNINSELLKKYTLLYVEDDDVIRTELSSLLENFFKSVIVVPNGKEGLRTYLTNQDNIDIILSDINMPELNGIDMVKKIREIKDDVPVVFATAHSDSDFLIEAIKLRVKEYIVKPLDIKKLLIFIEDIAKTLEFERVLNKQREELLKFKNILDTNNLLLKLDNNFKIIYVNKLFCKTLGYKKEDLLGQELNSLRHNNSAKKLFEDIYKKLLNKESWDGNLKIKRKDETILDTKSNIIPDLDDNLNIQGIILVAYDTTKEQELKRQMQLALIKEKSLNLQKIKEQNLEQDSFINEIKQELEDTKKELNLFKQQNNNQKVKDNTIKNFEDEKEVLNQRIKYLEAEIDRLNEMLLNNDSSEILKEKLEYWEQRSKQESEKLEILEKSIIANVEPAIIEKIFN